MAQYTITISDDDNLAVVVKLSGSDSPQGPAARLALGLVTLAPKLFAEAFCECEQCQIRRSLSTRAEQKPTTH